MKSSANKVINRVTKELLAPLGFVRVSDMHWTHDGNWWTVSVIFQQGSSRGAYVFAALQCLLESVHSIITEGVGSPRVRVNYNDDDVAFEHELHDALGLVLPSALDLVSKIHTPGDFFDRICTEINVDIYPRFYMGMLCALDSRYDEARKIFEGIIARKAEYEHEKIERAKACFGLKLLEKPSLVFDFAEVVIRQNHNELFSHDPRLPLVFPWR